MLGFIGRHKIAVAIIVIVLVAYWLFSGSGSSSDTSSSDGTVYGSPQADADVAQADIQAQSQLAALQYGYAAQGQQSQNQLDAQNAQIAGAEYIANLQAQTSQQYNVLAADVASQGISAQADVANQQTSGAVAVNAANNATQQAQIQATASVINNQTNALLGIAQANNAAAVQINKQNNSWCFITTAVHAALSKDFDDARDLQIYRDFRDNWLQFQPGGKDEIKLYYKHAPEIVRAINARKDRLIMWAVVKQEWLNPFAICIEAGYMQAAHAIYKDMVLHCADLAKVEYVP